MVLNKEKWTINDKSEFLEYLQTFARPEKSAWAKNLLKTESPVFAILTDDMVSICKEIMKGNYKSFLDLQIFDYYETIALYGMIISRMKTLDEMLPYLEIYLMNMNCWAHCDLLQLPCLEELKETYLHFSRMYRHDYRVMVRRFSLFILFQYVKDKDFLKNIFDGILAFKNEEEYYVIMMVGWLLSECIILHKEETLNFIKNNPINKKILNKGIQKCRESRRLTQEEKDYLLQFKVK